MKGLWRRESEMEMKLKVIQLCIDVSIWSMVAILGLECIQVKGEIIRIMTGIYREGRQGFRVKNEQLCVIVTQASRLMTKGSRLMKN